MYVCIRFLCCLRHSLFFITTNFGRKAGSPWCSKGVRKDLGLIRQDSSSSFLSSKLALVSSPPHSSDHFPSQENSQMIRFVFQLFGCRKRQGNLAGKWTIGSGIRLGLRLKHWWRLWQEGWLRGKLPHWVGRGSRVKGQGGSKWSWYEATGGGRVRPLNKIKREQMPIVRGWGHSHGSIILFASVQSQNYTNMNSVQGGGSCFCSPKSPLTIVSTLDKICAGLIHFLRPCKGHVCSRKEGLNISNAFKRFMSSCSESGSPFSSFSVFVPPTPHNVQLTADFPTGTLNLEWDDGGSTFPFQLDATWEIQILRNDPMVTAALVS